MFFISEFEKFRNKNLSKLSKIKGVIFDLDGVLVDTEKLHYLAWVKVLKPLGLNFSEEEFFGLAGKQIDFIATDLIKKYKLNISPKTLVKQRRKIAFEFFENSDLKLMPHAKSALSFLAKKSKIKLGLASGSIRKLIVSKLKRVGLDNFFSIIVAGDDVKRGKPFPDIYLLTIKKLKLKPKECLAFEDTEYGLKSAKSAGLRCFVVPNYYSRNQNFSKADKVFKNLKEAVEYIKRKTQLFAFL